jgi:protein-disulfide isomerase
MQSVGDPRHLEVVDAQGRGAQASGVTSTPTFFINGVRYRGSYELNSLIAAIEERTGILRVD